MTDADKKAKVLAFLQRCPFGVVSTLGLDGFPESAVVAVSETRNLEIIFGSFAETRKNRNLKRDSRVSVVIGWDRLEKTTVQIQGRAAFLEQEERQRAEQNHCLKNPESTKYLNDLRQEYIKIIPDWIRYSNFSKTPQEVWEIYNF